MKANGRTSTLWISALLAVACLVALAPAPALAQCTIPGTPIAVAGVVIGVLTETMESAPAHAAPGGTGPLNAGTYPAGQGVRLAQATERGALFLGCGTLANLAGDITVQAQSRILVVTDANGQPVINPASGAPDLSMGPITGTFKVDSATGTISGKLDGSLDFSLTNTGVTACSGFPCPIVTAEGGFSTQGKSKTSGNFSGVALVPFQNPLIGPGWFYLDPTGLLTGAPNAVVPLDPATDFNRQHGTPSAKFIITLFQF